MKNNYFFNVKLLALLLTMSVTTISAFAQWEQVQKQPSTQNVFVAPNGNLLSSDLLYTDRSGGIYLSEDQGVTWVKTDCKDYCYTKMVQAGEYIIAIGESCNIARSKDNGKTWEVLNYGYVFADILDDADIEYNVAYAVTYHNNRLYIGDFNGGGVIYSTDFGETWALTDRESLKYEITKSSMKDDVTTLDCYNDIAVNNGELLLFGVYFIYRYDEANDHWDLLRSDSNFMGVSTTIGDKLICGRATINDTFDVPFLEYTADGGRSWGEIPRPEGLIDNNVRAIHSDADGNLYVGLQNNGIYYTPDLGGHWAKISNGIPSYSGDNNTFYHSPLIIDSDDTYIYAAIYHTENISGVYRYKKDELPLAAVGKTFFDKEKVYVNNNKLYIGIDNAEINIYNIGGVCVSKLNNCSNQVDLSQLVCGIYIYEVKYNDQRITGKFVKK